MPSYLCECRARACRRSFDLSHETYSWLRSMGAVLAPGCAEREGREPVLTYEKGNCVVATTNGPRVRPPRSL